MSVLSLCGIILQRVFSFLPRDAMLALSWES